MVEPWENIPDQGISIPSTEERLEWFAQTLRQAQEQIYPKQLQRILEDFRRFIEERPAPPPSYLQRFQAQGGGFDYWQIALPDELEHPELDELSLLERIQEEIPVSQSYQALESELVTRNRFIYHNGHANPITLPEPLLFLETHPKSEEISWDCCVIVYPDASWYAYNLDGNQEESLGPDIRDRLEEWLPTLSKLKLVVPEEGSDYGVFAPL